MKKRWTLSFLFFIVMGLLCGARICKIHIFSVFEAYDTVLLTVVAMLYIQTLKLNSPST